MLLAMCAGMICAGDLAGGKDRQGGCRDAGCLCQRRGRRASACARPSPCSPPASPPGAAARATLAARYSSLPAHHRLQTCKWASSLGVSIREGGGVPVPVSREAPRLRLGWHDPAPACRRPPLQATAAPAPTFRACTPAWRISRGGSPTMWARGARPRPPRPVPVPVLRRLHRPSRR